MNNIINNINYTVVKSLDTYKVIKNTNDSVTLTYSLYKHDCNTNAFILIASGDLVTFEQFTFLPVVLDGKYKLSFTVSPSLGSGLDPDDFIGFYHYSNVRVSLIKDIKSLLCDKCNCNNCNDGDCISKEAKICLKHQSLFNTLETYKYYLGGLMVNSYVVSNDSLFTFIQLVTSTQYCKLNKELCKQLLQISLKGKPYSNVTLYKYYIALYYLGAYFSEKFTNPALTELQITTLDTLYDIEAIKECIYVLGISFSELEEIYEDIANENNEAIVVSNLPPTQASLVIAQFQTEQVTTQVVTLTSNNFLVDYIDPENNPPNAIRINTFILPVYIRLLLSDVEVEENQVISFEDIIAGNLTIEVDETDVISSFFIPYNISDSGSNTFGAGNGISIVISDNEFGLANQPPIKVGSVTMIIDNTENATVAVPIQNILDGYVDPENDALKNLKIVNLFAAGVLLSNLDSEIAYPAGASISYDDVFVQGHLGINVPSTTSVGTYTLLFQVSDEGSDVFGAYGNIIVTVVKNKAATYSASINTVNSIPVVNNQVVLPAGTSLATIIAVESSNVNTSSILWTFVGAAPNGVVLTNATTLSPTLTFVQNGQSISLLLTIINDGDTYTYEVNIAILSNVPTINILNTAYILTVVDSNGFYTGETVNLMQLLINNYQHSQGLLPTSITIITLPAAGILEVEGLPALSANQNLVLNYNVGQLNDRFRYLYDINNAIPFPNSVLFYYTFTDVNGYVSNIAPCQIIITD